MNFCLYYIKTCHIVHMERVGAYIALELVWVEIHPLVGMSNRVKWRREGIAFCSTLKGIQPNIKNSTRPIDSVVHQSCSPCSNLTLMRSSTDAFRESGVIAPGFWNAWSWISNRAWAVLWLEVILASYLFSSNWGAILWRIFEYVKAIFQKNKLDTSV